MRFWDAADLTLLGSIDTGLGNTRYLAMSLDGELIATSTSVDPVACWRVPAL